MSLRRTSYILGSGLNSNAPSDQRDGAIVVADVLTERPSDRSKPVSIDFKLDTGAKYTTISQDVALLLGFGYGWLHWPVELVCTVGQLIPVRRGLIWLRFPAFGYHLPVSLAILPANSSRPGLRLLGRDGVLDRFITVVHPTRGCSFLQSARLSLRLRETVSLRASHAGAFGSTAGVTINLSEAGLLVQTDCALVAGKDVEVSLAAPPVTLAGRVMTSWAADSQYRASIILHEPPPEYTDHVRALVAMSGVV